jgi:hypothetical protein
MLVRTERGLNRRNAGIHCPTICKIECGRHCLAPSLLDLGDDSIELGRIDIGKRNARLRWPTS